jgi:N-dimethylarginine dimethylaminohydrolase
MQAIHSFFHPICFFDILFPHILLFFPPLMNSYSEVQFEKREKILKVEAKHDGG